jgi:4-amino-4-deoxychorismate lyase
MSVTVLINGEPTRCIDFADRGFQYGDGVFTTILVRRGVPLFLHRHFMRLEQDCRRLMIPFPGSECLIEDIETLCRLKPDGVLKIQITRGIGGRGYRLPADAVATRVLSLHPLPDHPPELRENGVAVRICKVRLGINPALAGIKHMNRLEQILARAEWNSNPIREGLMLDAEGHVTEGTMSNLFLIRCGVLRTPKIDRCGVAGIMRSVVMEMGRAQGMAVEEGRLTLEDLFGADEVFLTNCVIGLWPVCRCEACGFTVGPMSREISRWLTIKVQEEWESAYTG